MRLYRVNDPIMPFTVKAPDNCCLFCKFCTDILYDYHGIYFTACSRGNDPDDNGTCECFEDEEKGGGAVAENIGDNEGPG